MVKRRQVADAWGFPGLRPTRSPAAACRRPSRSPSLVEAEEEAVPPGRSALLSSIQTAQGVPAEAGLTGTPRNQMGLRWGGGGWGVDTCWGGAANP